MMILKIFHQDVHKCRNSVGIAKSNIKLVPVTVLVPVPVIKK